MQKLINFYWQLELAIYYILQIWMSVQTVLMDVIKIVITALDPTHALVIQVSGSMVMDYTVMVKYNIF